LDLRGRKWWEAGEVRIMSFVTCTLHRMCLLVKVVDLHDMLLRDMVIG